MNLNQGSCIKVLLLFTCIFICTFSVYAAVDSNTYPYFVIVKPHGSITGLDIDEFAAYSYKNQEWKKVDLQVDERSDEDDYVLNEGLPYTRDLGNGFFDKNDEMVFNGKDFGEDFDLNKIPQRLNKHYIKKWKVSLESSSKNYGYLLVLHSSGDNPKVYKPPKVKFNPLKKEVSSSYFQYKFNEQKPALLGQVSLIENNEKINLIESSQFKVPVKLPWYLPNFTIVDDDFSSEIESWKQGPIRTIIAVGLKYKKFLFMFDMYFFTELVVYENALQIPTVLDFTQLDPSSFFKPGTGLVYALTYAQGQEWVINSNLQDLPLEGLDEYLSKPESKMASDYPYFFVSATKDQHSVYARVRVDKRASVLVPPPFLLKREMFSQKSRIKKWSWLKKLAGDIGVYIDVSRVKRGMYDFGLDLFLSSKAEEVNSVEISSIKTKWREFPATN